MSGGLREGGVSGIIEVVYINYGIYAFLPTFGGFGVVWPWWYWRGHSPVDHYYETYNNSYYKNIIRTLTITEKKN